MSDQGGLELSQDEAELAKLMREAQAGDSESYQRLLKRLKVMAEQFTNNSFARLGIERGGSATDDVVQEVLLGVHLKRNTYDPGQFFLPWFYAVSRYKIIDYFRRNRIARKRTVSLEDELETLEASLLAPQTETMAGHDVEQLLSRLPEKQREILKLIKLEGLSVADVASRTGYSASDVKVSVHRAIKALRLAIEEDSLGK
jgi:RNA polymerase sigma-70 factor (ECF subfamily)